MLKIFKNKVLVGAFVMALAVFGFAVSTNTADAAVTCAALATGAWSAPATWGGPCNTGAGGIPLAGDFVVINTGVVVTVDIASTPAVASININNPNAAANGITISGTNVLNVSGAVTFAGSSGAAASTIAVGTGTLSAGLISIIGGASTGASILSVGVGTITSTGTITFSGTPANSQLTAVGASIINVGGDFTSGGTLVGGASTITFNGAGAQSIGTYTTFNNVVKAGAGTATLATAGPITFGGTLAVNAGTLAGGITTLTVTGATNILAAGTFTINTLAVSAAGVTNNGILTVPTAITGANPLVNGATGTLTIGGTNAATLTANAVGNTVNYNGAGAQAVTVTPYYNLILSGGGTKTIGATTVIANNTSIAPTGAATATLTAGGASTTNTLTLGGITRTAGSYGGTTSAATNILPAFFANATGIITSAVTTPAVPVNLGSSANYVILSKTGITTTGTTLINGDIGISPALSTAITGFGLILDSSGTFATSSLLTGHVFAADYAAPTPATLTTAVSDMQTAYTSANAQATTVLNPGGGTCATTCDLGGLTLVPGVYTFNGPGNVNITSNLTLSGTSSGVWIFQIPGNLNMSSAMSVILSGGALPANVFWAVAGTTTLQPTSTFVGNILAGPGASTIAMQNGATLTGRALGQTNVSLIANAIASPGTGLPIVAPVSTGGGGGGGTGGGHTAPTLSGTTVAFTTACSPGQIFSTTNGQPCATVSAVVCASGQTFSPATGARCTSAVPVNVVICSPGETFSKTSGARCTSAVPVNVVICSPGETFSKTSGAACTTFLGSVPSISAASYAFGTGLVKQGSKGVACLAWQTFFNNNFQNSGLVLDGSCGPKTMTTARAWQKSVGLSADGVLGALSRGKANAQATH